VAGPSVGHTPSHWAKPNPTTRKKSLNQPNPTQANNKNTNQTKPNQTAKSKALALLATGDMEGCSATLSAQAHGAAKRALDAWNALFEVLIAKYRDGYKVRGSAVR
jgi:hypothetical protein